MSTEVRRTIPSHALLISIRLHRELSGSGYEFPNERTIILSCIWWNCVEMRRRWLNVGLPSLGVHCLNPVTRLNSRRRLVGHYVNFEHTKSRSSNSATRYLLNNRRGHIHPYTLGRSLFFTRSNPSVKRRWRLMVSLHVLRSNSPSRDPKPLMFWSRLIRII